jgi:defect-in-organelle-trafficking protein DotD
MKKKQIGIFLLAILLSACARIPNEQPASANYAPYADPAQVKLSESAAAISRSLISLAEIQQAVTPPTKKIQSLDSSVYGMSNLVSINWAGPIEPLIVQIAKSTGYSVRVFGRAPAIPVMVSLNAQNKTIGEVLTNAGYQAGDKADIIVFPKTHTIELRYATT